MQTVERFFFESVITLRNNDERYAMLTQIENSWNHHRSFLKDFLFELWMT